MIIYLFITYFNHFLARGSENFLTPHPLTPSLLTVLFFKVRSFVLRTLAAYPTIYCTLKYLTLPYLPYLTSPYIPPKKLTNYISYLNKSILVIKNIIIEI